MQVGNSKVKKILVGDKVIYRDSDGWIPLELADGVNGKVFFKDNGDGTAGLIGNLVFESTSTSGTNYGTGHSLVNPPQGYKFTSLDWNYLGETSNSIGTLGNMTNDSWFGSTPGSAIVDIEDGALNATMIRCYAGVTKPLTLISFSHFYTIANDNLVNAALPAIVGIEKG